MLNIGTKAPGFSLPDQNGNFHSLEEYRGRKLLLYFYPKDNTSGCSRQASAYSALKERFEASEITIVGVSKDSVPSHKKFEEKQGLTITLLSDPNREAIEAYDVWKEKKQCGRVSMGVVRTTYLIDEDGTIVFANNKVNAAADAENMLSEACCTK